jgi:hypothetical protein
MINECPKSFRALLLVENFVLISSPRKHIAPTALDASSSIAPTPQLNIGSPWTLLLRC